MGVGGNKYSWGSEFESLYRILDGSFCTCNHCNNSMGMCKDRKLTKKRPVRVDCEENRSHKSHFRCTVHECSNWNFGGCSIAQTSVLDTTSEAFYISKLEIQTVDAKNKKDQTTVWPNLAIFPHFGKILGTSLLQIFDSLFLIWQKVEPSLADLIHY